LGSNVLCVKLGCPHLEGRRNYQEQGKKGWAPCVNLLFERRYREQRENHNNRHKKKKKKEKKKRLRAKRGEVLNYAEMVRAFRSMGGSEGKKNAVSFGTENPCVKEKKNDEKKKSEKHASCREPGSRYGNTNGQKKEKGKGGV